MTLLQLKQSLIFALESSLVDLIERQIPNYYRGTPINIGTYINEVYQLDSIKAYHPAFLKNNGAFYLEPGTINVVSDNTNFASSVWVRGSNNISVLSDVGISPQGTLRADRVRWDRGVGSGQVFKRSLSLEPGKIYTAQWAIALHGGEPGVNDVIRVAGDIDESLSPSLSLGELEPYPKKMRLLTHFFKTGGKDLTSNEIGNETKTYAVTSVSTTTITIAGWVLSTGVDELVSAQVYLDLGNEGVSYTVIGNTATDIANSTITFTLDATDLVTDGVSTSNIVSIRKAPQQDVEIQIYVESTLSLNIGFLDIKEGNFPTSPVIQKEITALSNTTLLYRKSPLSGLENFSLFFDIQEWRGDGMLVDIDNVLLTVENGDLKITVDAVTFTCTNIPSQNLRILLIVSSEQRKIECYINNVLKAVRTLTVNVIGSLTTPLLFGTEGVRIFTKVLFFNQAIVGLDPLTEGDIGTGDIELVFADNNIVDSATISVNHPVITPGFLTIPAKPSPAVKTVVTSINTSTQTITVVDGTGLSNDDTILLLRKTRKLLTETEEPLFYRNIDSVSGNDIVLDSVAGINLNDLLILGSYDEPGIASIRFPYDPIDLHEIEAIDTGTKEITLSTVAAFDLKRDYIRSDNYQEISEVVVVSKDEINSKIVVNDVTGLEVGHFIAQPQTELLISPENYIVSLSQEIAGVENSGKYVNSVSFENNNDYPVVIEPIIQVIL